MPDFSVLKIPQRPKSAPIQMLLAAALAFASSTCTSAPHPTSSLPAPAGSEASTRNLARFTASSVTSTSSPSIDPFAGATSTGGSMAPYANLNPRVTIDLSDRHYLLKFPTSISADGTLIAGIVSGEDMGESFHPLWLRIKKVSIDRTVRLIDLNGDDTIRKLEVDCHGRLLGCVYVRELEEIAEAANAVLAENRWRVFPCYRDLGPTGPERLEAGCEKFRDVEVNYEKHHLRVTYHGHTLVNKSRPSWAYQGRLCKDSWEAVGMPMAFDPETGLLVVWIRAFAGSEVCDVPPDDFHAIRVPALRGEPLPDQDGGAP